MKLRFLSKLKQFRWSKLLLIWLVFLLIAGVLFAERCGIKYASTNFKIDYLSRTSVLPAQNALFGQPVTNLLLYDSTQDNVSEAKKQFDQILLDMKVSTQAVDISKSSTLLPDFSNYKTVVVLVPDLDVLGQDLITLMNWAQQGGSILFAMTPSKTSYFDVISLKLGVLSSSWNYKLAESIVPAEEFMLGGGQRYEFSDPFESALSVSLREEATVYARTGDEGTPLVWSVSLGSGRIVVDNIGIYDKIMRGIYAASFSLLCDATAYPVINGSVFYLDDFPSPVPGGDGTYIRRDYSMSISDFYSKVWWPDLVQLAQKYGVRFTGVMIENYEDDTVDEPTRQKDTQQFRYFGSLLLRQGGEVAAEAVLLGELVLRQLRVLAVGNVAIHLQAHHVVVQQDFQLLELRFHRLAPGGDRLRHRAALPFVQLELLADDVLAVIELRLQRVETLQRRAKLGADAVDALQRQRGQIRKLQLLQAPLQRQ